MRKGILRRGLMLAVFVILLLCGGNTRVLAADAEAAGADFSAQKRSGDSGDYMIITGYTGTDTDIVIPSEIGGVTVKAIAGDAFTNCSISLDSITIPDSVDQIDGFAAAACQNATVYYGGTLEQLLTAKAYSLGMYGKKTITADPVTLLGFSSAGIYDSEPLEHYWYIVATGEIDADGNETGILHLSGAGDSPYKVSDNTIRRHKGIITSVIVHEGVTSIKENFLNFSGCDAVASVELADSVQEIGDYAFRCKALASVNLPDSLISIGEGAFWETALEEIVIPKQVTEIKTNTFSRSYQLKEVTIPLAVKKIASGAFPGSSAKFDIVYAGTYTQWQEIEGYDTVAAVSIICTDGTYTPQGNLLTGEYEVSFENGNAEIVRYTGAQTEVTVPSEINGCPVTGIGTKAFQGNEIIQKVTIPDSITQIGEYIFQDCSSLTECRLPAGFTELPAGLFRGCSGLGSFGIPDGVKLIGDYAFTNSKIPSFEIPASVERIGEYAFAIDWYEAYDLTLYFKGAMPSIAETAFFCKEKAKVTGYYPYNDSSWKNRKSSYGGTEVEWIPYDPETGKVVCTSHDYELKETKKAVSCKESGYELSVCRVCGAENKIVTTGPHKMGEITVKPAKPGSNGYRKGKCSLCGKQLLNEVIYAPKTLTLSKTGFTYTGKVQKPKVTVKGSNGKEIKEYKVTYSGGCKNVGQYKVTVTFSGKNYSGALTKTFTIKPKGTTVSKLTASARGFTVTWKKQAVQTTGYEIEYSTSKSFKSGCRTVKVGNSKTISRKMTKLKAKKFYYVRVRTYKTVKTNGKSTKLYSGWSAAKKIKTK